MCDNKATLSIVDYRDDVELKSKNHELKDLVSLHAFPCTHLQLVTSDCAGDMDRSLSSATRTASFNGPSAVCMAS